ncbi:MAG: acyl-CoA dehydrogenase family protein [Acidimicrobiia bacterium]|nr:acyl-CoA dehydrogenase family protein [Acidimicrobiia bacterium]
MRAPDRVATQQLLGLRVQRLDFVVADQGVPADQVRRGDDTAPPRLGRVLRVAPQGVVVPAGLGHVPEGVFVRRPVVRRLRVGLRHTDPPPQLRDALVGDRRHEDKRIAFAFVARLALDRTSSSAEITAAVRAWVDVHVPAAWREASARGRAAIREVRSRADYEAWYPVFADSGLVVATWPVAYWGLDLSPEQARAAEVVLGPLNLGRLNPLGLSAAAPPLFAHGTEHQRRRFLPPLVRNEEKWCQLLSEPGAGSDLASLATRAVRDGDEWVLTGQKVWTTWAHVSDFAVCLARTDPRVPKRAGLTYFIVALGSPGVEVRPLRHIGGEVDFNEVFLDEVRVPDAHRLGPVGEGWRVANATLAGERQMVSGAGSGGVDRIGGAGAERLLRRAVELGRSADAVVRQQLMVLYSEERIRAWTNERVRASVRAGGTPGPAASIGKVHAASLNQRLQLLAADLLGMGAAAWRNDGGMPFEVQGMLRSRANSIEGGTTEVNKNILGERVLGLPREPDPWHDLPWEDVPRS